jgi:exodeoxyribonuclease VII large subunit
MPDQLNPKNNIPEYSVSQISTALKRAIETTFEKVRVRGEISGFHRAASGHIYLTLKDDSAILDGVIWRTTTPHLSFEPEDGLEVVAEGRVTTYAPRSRYQIVINRLEPAGVGALLALLEDRRKKLAEEGLFDDDLKQKIPYIPEVIGVITSPTGAVIRDILHRLRDRFPRTVVIWPVLVQGNGSAEQVAAAIRGFNELNTKTPISKPDLLIVARGGGSIEDLWAFNEEIVVRAASKSSIPLISAIGHETDTTLLDFVADLRAPTPTAAAEMAVPVRSDLLVTTSELERQLLGAVHRVVSEGQRTTDILGRSLPSASAFIGDAIQRLDDRTETIARIFSFYFDQLALRLEKTKIQIRHPKQKLAHCEERLRFTGKEVATAGARILQACLERYLRWSDNNRLSNAFEQTTVGKNRNLVANAALLESFSYKNVLERGYAVVRSSRNGLITRSKQLQKIKAAKIEFSDAKTDILIKQKPSLDKDSQGDLDTPDKAQGKLL